MKSFVIISVMCFLFIPSSVALAQWHVQEDFESNVMPPAGWSEYNLASSTDGWRMSFLGDPYAYNEPPAHSGTYFGHHDYEYVDCDTWLVSPAFTYAAGDMVVFWDANSWIDSGYYGRHALLVSIGSGDPNVGDFVEITHYGTHTPAFTERTADLATYCTPGDTVYIAFQYTGNGGAEWFIDDVSIGQDLWVDLLSFEADLIKDGIELVWETGAEIDSLGFNLIRQTLIGPNTFGLGNILNDSIIPSEGTAYSGATYIFIDPEIRAGATYRYSLEEVALNSESTILDSLEISTQRQRDIYPR